MALNVQFYEKVKDVQENQHECESKRLHLEQQLNSYMKSDHRLARLKAVRLQNYWKKLCEDEKRSQWRNDQLLKDLDRVENQMASLSARTDRLKTMKRQYEEYIERVYPQWKEKVVAYQELKKQAAQQEVQQYAAAAVAFQQGSPLPGTNIPFTSTPAVAGIHGQLPSFGPSMSALYASGIQAQSPQKQPHEIPSPVNYGNLNQFQGNVPQIQVVDPTGVAGRGLLRASAGSTMQTLSDLPTGYSMTSNQPFPQQQQQQQAANHSGVNYGRQATAEPIYQAGYEGGDGPPATRPQDNNLQYQQDQDDDTWRTEEQQFKTPQDVAASGGAQPPDNDLADTSEFASDVDLPLSMHDDDQTDIKPVPTPRSITPRSITPRSGRSQTPDSVRSIGSSDHQVVSRQSSAGSHGRLSRQQSAELEKPVYPQADVTLEGLYNLLNAVQESFPAAFTPEEFYRCAMPSMSVRKDIIDSANRGNTLSHVAGESISMVILDQLPLVSSNCEGNCLLMDELLFRPPTIITSDVIRSKIHPASQMLWDKLFEHFTKMVKYTIMQAEEISDTFAPLLIAQDSPYESTAQGVIHDLLKNLPAEDLQHSPGSTLSSLPMSPTGKPSFGYQDKPAAIDENRTNVQDSIPATAAGPAVQTGGFGQGLSSVGLTQSAAYRQLLGDTASTQKSVTYEDSDDDSLDSVEKALQAHSLKTSPRQEVPAAVTSTAKTTVVPTATNEEKDVSELSSAHSVGGGTGYLPSGIDTGKTTTSLASSGKSAAKKSAAFMYGDSDTDEDVDINPANKTDNSEKQAEEDSDFAFYS